MSVAPKRTCNSYFCVLAGQSFNATVLSVGSRKSACYKITIGQNNKREDYTFIFSSMQRDHS